MINRNLAIILLFLTFFLQLNGQIVSDHQRVDADLLLFDSPLALKLKKGIKKKDIEKIQNEQLRSVAAQLLEKSYNSAYRYATYYPVFNPTALGKQLWIGDGYSKYENVTGVYLPKGKHIVLVDMPENENVSLVIPNWLRQPPNLANPTEDPAGWGLYNKSIKLNNGINIIDITNEEGLAYVQFFTNDPSSKDSIKIHFPAAKVNGYFDISKHNNEDWDRLLKNAVYPIMDGLGKHIQIAYPVADCQKYAPSLGVELITNYDSLVYLQHKIMGLVKYNRVPKNRILSRVNYNYYMFRDHDGVAYMGGEDGYAMHLVVDPARVIKGDPCWGFAHEIGHVHQLRPFFNWGGTAEVSNNVFSLYVNTHFGTKSRIQEQNNYQKSKESIINKKISYLQDPDVFNRLVPFWQLHLYFTKIETTEDFYPDLFEAFRQQGDSLLNSKDKKHDLGGDNWGNRGGNPAVYQLNFVETACKIGTIDLTEFFDKYGFFHVGEFEYDDYGKYKYSMTQEMVDESKKKIAAMKLPQPKLDLSTLTDDNTK